MNRIDDFVMHVSGDTPDEAEAARKKFEALARTGLTVWLPIRIVCCDGQMMTARVVDAPREETE